MNFVETPEQPTELKPQPKKDSRRRTRSSLQKEEQAEPGGSRVNGTEHDDDRMNLVGDEAVAEHSTTRMDTSKESTKISIPFSDTPVINRNKELRKTGNGRRRSSLGTRGRRASSLIDSGHNATPHHEVDSSQFYKHIESEGLSEPRRMKQLLIWCAERAVLPKPTTINKDNAAINSGEWTSE
jgi:kinetochore protein Mis13/DSN1